MIFFTNRPIYLCYKYVEFILMYIFRHVVIKKEETFKKIFFNIIWWPPCTNSEDPLWDTDPLLKISDLDGDPRFMKTS